MITKLVSNGLSIWSDKSIVNHSNRQLYTKNEPKTIPSIPETSSTYMASDKTVPPIWHKARFIPEVLFSLKKTIPAFKSFKLNPKIVILNYIDLKKRGILKPEKLKSLRADLGYPDAIILTCIGKDEELDNIAINAYHNAALAIKADAVTTIDTYMYLVDDDYSQFRLEKFLEAKKRTIELLDLCNGEYSVIGLVIGMNETQIRDYMRFLAKRGINNFAFPCGDYIKSASDLELIKTFCSLCKDLEGWSLLLRVNSHKHLSQLKSDCSSNESWSFDAVHGKVFINRKTVNAKQTQIDRNDLPASNVVDRALHNLQQCYLYSMDHRGENYGS